MTTDAKEVMTVPKKEQNAGVALLLERMKTNPEEFNGDRREGSKWLALFDRFKMHLTAEDRDALNAGIDTIMQQRFTERVLEGLVDPKPSKLEELLAMANNTNATVTWGDSTLTQALATLEEIKKEYEPKKHKTLFGRLKNYLHDDK